MIARRLSSTFLVSSVLLVAGCLESTDRGLQADGGDNDLPGVAYIVGPAPDLVVSTVNDPPTDAVLGQMFSASETVTNQGSADAGATFTKYYLSSNGTTPQYLLGNRSVGAITTGSADSGTAVVTVPKAVPGGPYHVLACADSGPGTGGRISQVAESIESNNCTASAGQVSITGPDLTESNVSVSPTTLAASGTLTVTETVTNIGAQPAGASVTRWFLSTDNVKDANDGFIRNCINGNPIPGRNVGTLSAGANSPGSATTTPLCVRDSAGLHPPASGTYYVIACADSANQVSELIESNNCAVSTNTVQVVGGADLTETTVSNPPPTGAVGTSFSVSDTVQNIGGDPAPSSFTKYYLSTNGVTLSFWLGARSVGALAPLATDSGTLTVTIQNGTAGGTYRLVACADSGPGTAGRISQIAETNEANNCRASTSTITVGSPDLVISAISDPPATGSPNGTFAISDTTTNQGLTASGSFFNKYYLSSNGTTPSYLLAPGAAAAPLAAGASEPVSATATIPRTTPLGTYWVLGCADAGPGTGGKISQVKESNEQNNCTRSATQIIVQ